MSVRLGKGFADSVHTGHPSKKIKAVNALLQTDRGIRLWRLSFLFIFMLASFVLLGGRLFHLTIIYGERNRQLAESNRTRERLIPAPRGIIFDRFGEALVHNVNVEKNAGSAQSLSLDANHMISRTYPYGSIFAHVLGYVGEFSPEELQKKNSQCNPSLCHYYAGELVGRGGIEESYDTKLRGKPGQELIEVDAIGKPLRLLGTHDPVKGENITLSLDAELQKLSASLMASVSGVIIATVPQTGEILALYSSPSFDPNAFTMGDDVVDDTMNRTDQPLFNRAISGLYPPGSTYKLITSVAGLEEGAIKPETEFEDTGVITVGPYSFPNWYFIQYGGKEGMVNVIKALARSNDIFFYHVGELLGNTKLNKWTKKFFVDTKLAVDLPGANAGLVPDQKWKKKELGEDWYLGDTYHQSIGQGFVLATPLHVNVWTNIIANDGLACVPHVIQNPSDQKRFACTQVGIAASTVKQVKAGMIGACTTGGTAWPLFNFSVENDSLPMDSGDFYPVPASVSAQKRVGVKIACKTGTAEYGDPDKKTHAWLTLFAPVDHPQISITVLVEGGGEGSSTGGPIVRRLLEYWFSRKQ